MNGQNFHKYLQEKRCRTTDSEPLVWVKYHWEY